MNNGPKYALIGATGIGGYHLSAIQELRKDGLARLTAVADPALARLPELRTELTSQGTRCYLNHQDLLLEETELDVVVISVPIPFHFEIALACLERDLFVYLEKPPVPLIQQLEVLIDADKYQRIGVGFQMIAAKWTQSLKQIITDGKLGLIEYIRIGACWPRVDQYYARNSSAGKMQVEGKPVFDGPATNALAHLIHNAMYFASEGRDTFDIPVEVQAELYCARPMEGYDIACLRGKFESGIKFNAALTHATEAKLPFQIEVRGSKGWGRISKDGSLFETSFAQSDYCEESTEQLLDKTHRQFVAYVRGDLPRFSTMLADTLGYVLATNGMLLSSGGIHPVAPKFTRRDKEGSFDVAGLFDAVTTSFQTARLFSEMGLPWAVPTGPVSVENLRMLSL